MTSYRHLSLWWDTLDTQPESRPALGGDLDVDVAIVGGGFTGLWTARSIQQADPTVRIALVESEVCGFGASGRNGGWASALFSAHDNRIAREHGLDAARAMRAAMNDTVVEIDRAAARDGIDCHYNRGGTIVAARAPAQVARAQAAVGEARELGFGEDELRWLSATEATEMIGASELLGATYTPHCAVIHPAKLAIGLARAVTEGGADVFEHTTATTIVPGSAHARPRVVTTGGTITADVVVRATEGWTSQLSGSKRAVIPVYSLMIATEPLDEDTLGSIGLENRETFSDHRNMVIYGQRTHDGRIAFGGRGAPYHYGSAIRSEFDRDAGVFADLRRTLVELFPILQDTVITHSWGGPLGIPRDWFSSVGLDHGTGIAWAGGYVGDGVTTTNLAGRTLRDLILGEATPLTALPWVGHRSPEWEPEPFRWLGVNAGLAATHWADTQEERRGKPSRLAGHMARLLGG